MFFLEKQEKLNKAISFHGEYNYILSVKLEDRMDDMGKEKWCDVYITNAWEYICTIGDCKYLFTISDYNEVHKKVILNKI